MATQLILNFIADDRPGLVDMLSEAVTGADGNWLESKTAQLAGKFAGIIRVELPGAENADALKARLDTFDAMTIHVTQATAEADYSSSGPALTIDLVGPDHPGIVHDISHCLAQYGASIETMDTFTSDAPQSGGMLFHAHIEVRGPTGMEDEALREELEKLANALMVDIDLG